MMSIESETENIGKNTVESINKAIERKKDCLAELVGCQCFPFLLNLSSVDGRLVDDVIHNLKDNYTKG
jgi:hypothetical protein